MPMIVMKGNNALPFVLLLLVFLLNSCSNVLNKELSETDYKKWFSKTKKEITKTETYGDLNLSMQYIPAAVQYLREKVHQKDVKPADYADYTMFNLDVYTSSGALLYGQMQEAMNQHEFNYYFSYDFSKQIQAVQGDKTLGCIMYHYSKGIEQGKNLQFMIGFDGLNQSEPFDIVLNDAVFGNGKIKYHYEPTFFNALPTLKS